MCTTLNPNTWTRILQDDKKKKEKVAKVAKVKGSDDDGSDSDSDWYPQQPNPEPQTLTGQPFILVNPQLLTLDLGVGARYPCTTTLNIPNPQPSTHL